jgi:hypothetical protein
MTACTNAYRVHEVTRIGRRSFHSCACGVTTVRDCDIYCHGNDELSPNSDPGAQDTHHACFRGPYSNLSQMEKKSRYSVLPDLGITDYAFAHAVQENQFGLYCLYPPYPQMENWTPDVEFVLHPKKHTRAFSSNHVHFVQYNCNSWIHGSPNQDMEQRRQVMASRYASGASASSPSPCFNIRV